MKENNFQDLTPMGYKKTSDARIFFLERNHLIVGWFAWFIAMHEKNQPKTGYWRKIQWKEEYDEGFREIQSACDFLEKEGRWPDEVNLNNTAIV